MRCLRVGARWLPMFLVVSVLGLGLAAQTAPAAPLAVTCSPRPPVTVATTAVLGTPGSLQATIAATGVGNTLTALRFDDPRPSANATIDVGGQNGRSGAFTYTPPANTTTVTFTVHPVAVGQAATVNLTAVDGCGDWPTLVGGGSSALPSLTSTPTNGPSPTRTATITPTVTLTRTPTATITGNPPCTSVFTGAGPFWDDPNNWAPPGVPGAASDVCVPSGIPIELTIRDARSAHSLHAESRVAVAGGSLDLASASDVSSTFATNGGLSGAGDLRVSGTFNWAEGTLSGSGALNVVSGGTLNITTGGAKTLSGRTINNAGTVTWTGFAIQGNNHGTINNSGLFDIQGDLTFQSNAVSGDNPSFNNQAAGTLRKSAGSGTATFDAVLLNNAGTITPQMGTLALSVGGTSVGGSFSPAAGAAITFPGNTHAINGVTFAGAGTNQIAGAVLSVAGNSTARNLDLASGSIQGSADLAIPSGGTLRWTGGTMGNPAGANPPPASPIGTTTVQAGGTLAISGSGPKELSNRTINNSGTTTWAGSGPINGHFWGVFNNLGLFDAQADATFHDAVCCNDDPTFNNQSGGTFRKSAGVSTTFDNRNVFHLNGGTVNVQAGALLFSDGAFASGGTFGSGAGTTQVSGGTFQVTNTVSVTGSFTLTDTASVQGTGDLNVGSGGTLNWMGGTMGNPLGASPPPIGTTTIQPGGNFAIGGAAVKSLRNRTINAGGTTIWTGAGDIQAQNGGVFNNSGLFEARTDSAFHGVACCFDNGAFNNLAGGVFAKTQGSGTTLVGNDPPNSQNGISVTNAGTVQVSTGTLLVNDLSGNFVSAGSIELSGPTGGPYGTLKTAGTVTVQAGGVLFGIGTVDAPLDNRGTIRPGGAGFVGTLTTTKGYSQSEEGALSVDVKGAGTGTPCTTNDLLEVGNGAILALGSTANTVVQVTLADGCVLPVTPPATQFIFLHAPNGVSGFFSQEHTPPNYAVNYSPFFTSIVSGIPGSPPPNDNFAARQQTSHGSGYDRNTTLATVEAGEPGTVAPLTCTGTTIDKTMWFAFTYSDDIHLPATTSLRVNTTGGFNMVIQIYQTATGDPASSLADLLPYPDSRACSNNGTATGDAFAPTIQRGKTVYIQVGGRTGEGGHIQVGLSGS